MSPTTPSQPQSPKLKFMPGNHRSATVSDDIPKPPYVNSRILRDVKSHQTCKFNAMLKAMLKRCLPDNPESDLDQVLKRCLDAMIPLCNEDNELRSHLYDYCKTISIERNRYAPFVRLCNHALDVLGSKKLPNLQHLIPLISSDRILFHVSDSSVINCSHGHHKPDVVLVPFKAVQESAHEDHRHDLDSWKDVITKTATSPPHRAFSWENILLPLEFKTAKRKLNSPPKTYEIKETKHVRPIRTPSYGISDSWISTSSAGLTTASMSREGVSIEEATTSASKQSAGSKSTPSRASNKQKESGDRGSDSIIRPERHSTRLQGKTSASDSQYSAGIGTKRPLESGTTETSAKRQRIEKPRWTLHVNVRTALYGSEILSHSPFSASAMAMVIVGERVISFSSLSVALTSCLDSVVYLWWYDRQGAIQTHGLDFIEDLPHFLVLLFALQRLPPKGWGKIDTPESQIHLEGQYGEMGVKLGKQLVEHWGIQGRATNILEVKALSLPPLIPSRLKERLETQGMVVKLSWAQSKRVRESEIIQEISKRIKKLSEEDQDAIEGHIPDMITSNTFPAFETRNIRNDLGIAVEDIENRVLIMSVFRKLRPITELEGDEFWRAWWDCVLCKSTIRCLITLYMLMSVEFRPLCTLENWNTASGHQCRKSDVLQIQRPGDGGIE
ncbi:hypothetical protein FRC02_004400 [Tulasnella sp. 418]|nr:hypothetical protein FRC02_004400 [Tulasnella sp. 418]